MAEAFALKVTDLYAERDDRSLFSGLSFEVKPGQFWQVEGPNGSGKTTLLRILAGLSDDYSGDISWCQQPVAAARLAYSQSMLYGGHLAAIKPSLTPAENLRWFFSLHQPLSESALQDALYRVGLRGYEDQPCHTLSAGQQRRVALARLELAQHPLWILDEPFTAIDLEGVAALEAQLLAHVRSGGAVIVTTHHRLGLECEQIRRVSLNGGDAL